MLFQAVDESRNIKLSMAWLERARESNHHRTDGEGGEGNDTIALLRKQVQMVSVK